MSKYDGEPTVTARKAEDVWFRCYCTKCGTYLDGMGTVIEIQKGRVFTPRCDCDDGMRQLVEVPRGDA